MFCAHGLCVKEVCCVGLKYSELLTKGLKCEGSKIIIEIRENHVGMSFDLQCRLKTNKNWHRMSQGVDDLLVYKVRVLPPI